MPPPPTGPLADRTPTGLLADRTPTGLLADRTPTGSLADRTPTGSLADRTPTGPAPTQALAPPHGPANPQPRVRLADSWQRIDGVSRLLPYSDLLALTSSSRRWEATSDRGSWKRMRILMTGHADTHAEPAIGTGGSLIGPA